MEINAKNAHPPFTVSASFRNEVEIQVEENIGRRYARFTVSLEFALFLRKNDVLLFNEHGKEKPPWVLREIENYHLLEDGAIKITERLIFSDHIQFYACFA